MFIVILVLPQAHSAHLKLLDSLKSKVLDYMCTHPIWIMCFINYSPQFFQQERYYVNVIKSSAAKSQEAQKKEAALNLTYLCLFPSISSPHPPWGAPHWSSLLPQSHWVIFWIYFVPFSNCLAQLQNQTAHAYSSSMVNHVEKKGVTHGAETQKLQECYRWYLCRKNLSISSTQPTGMTKKVMLY